LSTEQEFSGEQSRQITALIREEIARRRMSRQQLADKAKLSLSTLEKVLGGRRPLTLATAVRVEEALGVSLRRSAPDAEAPPKDGVAPDGLGAYSRRGATWLEGVYVTVRPSFGEKGAIYAYRNEILWDEASSRLVFREAERVDAVLSSTVLLRHRCSANSIGPASISPPWSSTRLLPNRLPRVTLRVTWARRGGARTWRGIFSLYGGWRRY
jgi:transcriptional regulator with XRE-family HTH domain